MAPKKRARASTRNASTPAQESGDTQDAMVVDTPEVVETPDVTGLSKNEDYEILKDPWTDEQETSLYKGIIRWKPAGMHKHFRMIALSEHLRNHGYDPKIHVHTRIPGIWKKLGTLYNLEVIDERENSFDYVEEDTIEKRYLEFTLPEDDFGNMMWVKGMASSNAGSSPSRLHATSEPTEPLKKKRKRGETLTASRARASTIEDTDEAKTSPAPSPAAKPGRALRGGKRLSNRLKVDPSDRQASKDTTADEVDDDKEEKLDLMEIVDDEHEDEEDGEDGTPSPRTSRSAAKAAKGGTQARTQSSTRKSTRRK